MDPKISGVSLREPHFPQFESHPRLNQAFEVIYENYIYTKGERRERLKDFSRHRFVHLHGVSTNIGSFDPLDLHQLSQLKELVHETQAKLVSDHLCWTRLNQRSTYELLPIPRTRKMLKHIGERVDQIQNILGQEFLLENISSYFSYELDEMSDLEFMSELNQKFDIRFLLDVNNLFVNSYNFHFSADQFISQLPAQSVSAFHLGGHADFETFLFDTHGTSVSARVAELFHRAVLRFGEKPTFLERDENLPHDLTSLTEELMSIIGVKK